MLRFAVVVVVLFGATTAASAATRYVTARYLVVRAGTTSSSATVTTLRFGDAVETLAEAAPFTKVRTGAGEGWVASRWLGDKPSSRGGLLARYGAAARSGSGEVGTTAGARGLAPEATAYADARADLVAAKADVLALEALVIEIDALDAFLRDGGLGDYRAAGATP